MFAERFMAWSQAACVDQRARAIAHLVQAFNKISPSCPERAPMERVLTLYLKDPSTKVRKSLARSLSRLPDAPRHLVWALAQDLAEISVHIYLRSSVLRSRDLIETVRRGDPFLQLAIASRSNMDGDVIRALVEHACEDAALKLLKNNKIVLGPGLKHDLAVRLGHLPAIRQELLDDDGLDAGTRQLLSERLSTSLLNLTCLKGWGDQDRLANVSKDACNRVAVEIAMQTPPEQVADYVQHLRETKQLTAALLVRACCMGHAALFDTAISVLSGTSLRRVQSIIDEGRIAAFRSLYSRTGLPISAFPVFAAAINAWQRQDQSCDVIGDILSVVEADAHVDGGLVAMVGRMSVEVQQDAAHIDEPQLRLAA